MQNEKESDTYNCFCCYFNSSLLWASTLIKCEILTQKYYDDFKQAYTQNTMLGEMEYFKVLSCDENTAEVYYVGKGMTDANVLSFENNNGVWQEISWKTIWSASGSATKGSNITMLSITSLRRSRNFTEY